MRRYILIVALALALVALAGCGSSDEGGSDASVPEEESSAVAYSAVEMDANAEAAQPPATVIDEFIAEAEADGDVEGEDYFDLRGVEPVFVGYEAIAWSPLEGSEDIQFVDLNYFDGVVSDWYSSPDEEASEAQEFDTKHVMNVENLSLTPSDNEQEALDAVEASLAQIMPDFAYDSIAIERYLFVYSQDGQGQVIGADAGGEIGGYSGVIPIAE